MSSLILFATIFAIVVAICIGAYDSILKSILVWGIWIVFIYLIASL